MNYTLNKFEAHLSRYFWGVPPYKFKIEMELLNSITPNLRLNFKPHPLQQTLKSAILTIKRNYCITKESDENLGHVLMNKTLYQKLFDSEITSSCFEEVSNFPRLAHLGPLQTIVGKSTMLSEGLTSRTDGAIKHTVPSSFCIIPQINNLSWNLDQSRFNIHTSSVIFLADLIIVSMRLKKSCLQFQLKGSNFWDNVMELHHIIISSSLLMMWNTCIH